MRKQTVLVVTVLVVAAMLLAGCALPSLPSFDLGLSGQRSQAAPLAQMQATPVAPAPAAVPSGNAALIAAMESTLQQIYAQVNPSVVNIQVTQNVSSQLQQMPGFPFQNQPDTPQLQQGLGSGFVWDKQGHIVTNYHVVDSATDIQVTFYDGTTVAGKVIGTDPDSDLAVVQVDMPADQLQPVQVADSTQVKVGEMAIAIGNPFGLENTMTSGIISAIGRSIDSQSIGQGGSSYTIPDIIQTDAPINPGNSGGVLLDDQGRLIGVTSAIESTSRSNSGIGFAIPSAIVQQVVPSLINGGSFAHPWLGISGTTLTPDLAKAMNLDANQRGALVIEVVAGSPAEKAGLQASNQEATISGQQVPVGGDVITAVDGQPVKKFEDLPSFLARSQVGQEVTLTVLRGGQEQTLKLTLGARPATSPSAAATSVPNQGTVRGRGRLGIVGIALTPALAGAMNLPENQQGVLIQQVQPDSPADQAGLRGSFKPVTVDGQEVSVGGDVITAVNGQAITSLSDLSNALQQTQSGQTITLTLLRDGEQMQVDVTLAAAP